MNENTLAVMKAELAWDCWTAQGGWVRLHDMKRSRKIPGMVKGLRAGRLNTDPVLLWSTRSWAEAHAILSGSATISRTLWPGSRAKHATKQRAGDLLQLLDLPPLPELEKRDVRNAYEHSENDAPEWLEWALKRYPGRPLMGWAIGDGTTLGPRKLLPEECFRYLDNKAWTLRVGREPPLDLKQLMVAIEALAGSIRVDPRFEVETPP